MPSRILRGGDRELDRARHAETRERAGLFETEAIGLARRVEGNGVVHEFILPRRRGRSLLVRRGRP